MSSPIFAQAVQFQPYAVPSNPPAVSLAVDRGRPLGHCALPRRRGERSLSVLAVRAVPQRSSRFSFLSE